MFSSFQTPTPTRSSSKTVTSMELPAHLAHHLFLADGNVEAGMAAVADNPSDVNARSPILGETLLHAACDGKHVGIVYDLLKTPGIDVNATSKMGDTPFIFVCKNGGLACFRLMLRDLRVETTRCDMDGCSPLFFVAGRGYLDLAKHWIASGRSMDLGPKGDGSKDVILEARRNERKEMVALLERFCENISKTRYEVRLELGMGDKVVGGWLANIVFLCDGLLRIRDALPDLDTNEGRNATNAARFLWMAERLPLEVQMILCYRVVGSTQNNIPAKTRERAFRLLGKTYSKTRKK